MDTEAIASEVVSIKNRLEEIEQDAEIDASEVEEERSRLAERLRYLQGRLSGKPSGNSDQDKPAKPDDVPYIPPV